MIAFDPGLGSSGSYHETVSLDTNRPSGLRFIEHQVAENEGLDHV